MFDVKTYGDQRPEGEQQREEFTSKVGMPGVQLQFPSNVVACVLQREEEYVSQRKGNKQVQIGITVWYDMDAMIGIII